MIEIGGGSFVMGTNDEDSAVGDGEGPLREVTVSTFWIDDTCVTNRQFQRFVEATSHVTDAERFGWSFVFSGLLQPEAEDHVIHAVVPSVPWWLPVRGAYWRAPNGPGSAIEDQLEHPVVHVSWNDAAAYAQWVGKRLPTEAEWEKAARGGLVSARFSWGDELVVGGKHRANLWQGEFPTTNTLEDGFYGTAPVRSYPPNAFGLYEVTGNVWEWCAEWWSHTWHTPTHTDTRFEPAGPPEGKDKVMRGGSYLCHASYCNRYRASARAHNTPDSSSGNIGFRCVANVSP